MHIFLTGGAGFLGRAIMRRASLFSPDPIQFTVYSRDEAKQSAARTEFPDATYILGDVRDYDRLNLAMAGHDVVLHLAAMKYVPQGESNVWEVMAVNVDGSANVALTAAANGVSQVVGISTDKACRPVNVYGMSKLVMERMFQEAAGWETGTKFNLVRYGNVVASTGSVIPMFRQQAQQGTITLTDPYMTRFWLSVDNAVELIAEALREPEGGTVLIPLLDSAIMRDVADAAIDVELGDDHKDIYFKITGPRFGEKTHEDLLGPQERPYAACGPRDDVIRLYPVTQGPREGQWPDAYSSEAPLHGLSVDNLVDLIQESGE